MTFMRKLLDALNMDNWNKNTVNSISDKDQINCIAPGKPFDLHYGNSKQKVFDDLFSRYNGTLPKSKKELIATEILSSVGMFTRCNNMSIEAKNFLSTNPSRIDTCAYGAQICIPPKNNNELYIIATAYEWAGATYRKEAIYWYEKYIENGAISDYIQSFIIHEDNYSYDQRIKFVSISHGTLGELYAAERQFEKSNIEYETAIKIAPFLPSNYIKLARNHITLKDFDKYDEVISEAQASIFYRIDKFFKMAIDTNAAKMSSEIDKINYYINTVIPMILKIIDDMPGVLQKDLHTHFTDIDKQHIQWVCKYLEREGKIHRAKKGNTYSLFLIQ